MVRLTHLSALVVLLAGPAWAADPACEAPNMLIVLDISGSMTDPPVAGSGTKFEIASAAIQTTVSTYGAVVGFGLALFPWDTTCGAGVVRVPPGLNTAAPIMDELGKTKPYGATPIAATLRTLAGEPSIHDPARRNIILFITDGNDTCAPDLEKDPVDAAAALYAQGVGVIVVGFSGVDIDPNVLSNMARAGGYPRSGTPAFHQADSASDLNVALREIIDNITAELCDGRDNDCDGMIDEDANGDPMTRPCAGRCGGGIMRCVNGAWDDATCNGPEPGNACGGCGATPREACNGRDDDCNGLVDDAAVCPDPDDVCIAGLCLTRCRSNECPAGRTCASVGGQMLCVGPDDTACIDVPCVEGMVCSDGACVEIPCFEDATRCAGGLRQRCGAGQWVDDPCPEGFGCLNSVCVEASCYTQGCPDGFVCTAGACDAPDPCASTDCPDDAFCRDGQCVKACGFVDCASGTTCRDGACFSDPCAEVSCQPETACAGGACAKDPCYWVGCGYGRVCANGVCRDDPCRAIHCPDGTVCYDAQCVKPGDVPVIEYPDAGSGGSGDAGAVAADSGPGGGAGGDDAADAGPSSSDAGAGQTSAAGCACALVGID